MWAIGIYLFKVKLPWRQIAKIVLVSALAALTAYFIAAHLNPLWAVLCGGSVSLTVLFALFYLLRVLEPEDHVRFQTLTGMLPKPISAPAGRLLAILARSEAATRLV
jgi:hypothetical protein